MVSKAAEAKTKLAGGRARATGALQAQRKKPAVVAPAANRKLKTCKEKRVVETELTSSQESTTSSSQESAASADANVSDISMADLEIRCVGRCQETAFGCPCKGSGEHIAVTWIETVYI